MFNGNAMPSLADIAAVTGNDRNDDNFGGSGWWVIIIFAMIFGWGGFGNGRNNGGGMNSTASAYTDSAIQRGFDNATVVSKLDGITNGLCDGFYAVNNSLLTGFNGVNTNVMQTGYGIQQAINADTIANMQNTNALQTQLAECCCNTQSGMKDIQYQNATDTCAITTAIAQQTQDIMNNCNANYRALHDEFVASQMDAKNEKIAEQAQQIQALNLTASQQAQNQYLINALKPAPIPSFPAANLYGGLYGTTGCSGCNGTSTIGF